MDRIDPYRFVRFSQIFGRITLTWPPPSKTRTSLLFVNDLLWIFGVLSNILCFTFVFLKIRRLEDDPIALSKLFSLFAIMGDACLQLVLVRIQWPRLQVLIDEITSFLKTAKRGERKIFRKYIKRYLGYHIFLYGTFYAAIGAFAFSPLTLNKRFPIDAWYPFSTDPMFNRIVIYVIQYNMILQTPTLLSGDIMVVTLLWYSSARLELLGLEFRKIDDGFQLRNCARNHQEILRETEFAVRLLVMKILFAVSVTIVSAGVQLSHHRSLTVLSQFLLIVCIGSVRLLGFTWAGDDLTEMGSSISSSIYQSPAITRSLYLRKSLSIVMQRSQRPMIINMCGESLGLSLEFFTTYALRVMSFFMTLRAVVDRYL